MAYSVDYIYRILDKYTAPLRKIGITQANFQKHVDKSKAKIMRLKGALTSNIATMIGWGAAIYGVGKALKTGISLASDLTEVQNVVDVTFGDSTETINAWSQRALEGFGLSELQAKKFTGTIGAMLKSTGIAGQDLTGMSTKLAGLAGDFASFYNLPHEEAFNKIRAGISGETEPLKQIGINMSVANLEAFALTQGITKQYKQMTQAEQVALRYNFLIKASADAQGDFAKTLETSYANQIRVLKTRFQEKLANSMKDLLPVLVKVLRAMNKFVQSIDTKKISKFIMGMVKVIGVFIKVIKFLKPLLPIIIGIIAAWKAYQAVTMIVAIAQMALNAVMTANPIGLIITGIGILIGLLYLLVKHWATVEKVMVESWDKFKGILFLVIPSLVTTIEIIRSLVENWKHVKKAFSEKGFLAGIWAIGKAILSGILSPIEALLRAASKIPKVGKWAKQAADGIQNFRDNLFPKGTEEELDKVGKKTKEIVKKTREEVKKPIDISKITDAQRRSMLAYKEAQYDAREKFAFTEKYVSKPTEPVKMGEGDKTMSANLDLRVYNETESKIEPYNNKGNLGYNEVGK
jgi:hypothetical protein